MAKLVLVRHGQSEYNLKNLFTGWIDVPLTPLGEEEAAKSAEFLKSKNFVPQLAYTSDLQRAQKTLDIILDILNLKNLEVFKDKALNERDYGDLSGKNKAQTAEEFGAEQVHIWRRSYDVAPPGGESLKNTADRTLPYFRDKVLASLKEGKDVLVVAHGNSLRSIVMEVEKLSPEQILKREIKTGEALVYSYEADAFNLIP
jgi:2,3-bisphosphoglycerate-dependent phosphoglycerate mutase